MAFSTETVRELLIQSIGFDPGTAEVERLLPLVERQQARMQALRELDLGGDDPRTMSYITDNRLGWPGASARSGE